jgi:hypothetical protein
VPGIWILTIVIKISAGLKAYILIRFSERVSIGKYRLSKYPIPTTTTIGNNTSIKALMSIAAPIFLACPKNHPPTYFVTAPKIISSINRSTGA